MADGPYDPLHGMPRPRAETARTTDFEEVLDKVEELFEEQEYVAGVELFAKQLDALQAAHPDTFTSEKIQKPARIALAELWKAFLKETRSPHKKAERIVSEDPVLEQDLKQLDSHAIVEEGLGLPFFALHGEFHDISNEHTQFTGTLYNDVLPLLTTHIQGHLGRLLQGNNGRAHYLPVSGEAIRAVFVPFLTRAQEITRILAEALLERDKRLKGRK